jgi:hypothetical protein
MSSDNDGNDEEFQDLLIKVKKNKSKREGYQNKDIIEKQSFKTTNEKESFQFKGIENTYRANETQKEILSTNSITKSK